MRIGTITFHWAKNYGAILQAYALQQYLKVKGYDNEIINYLPINVIIRLTLSDIKNFNMSNFIKEIKLKFFRTKYLTFSQDTFNNSHDLKKACNNYDINICGSDQVWNE